MRQMAENVDEQESVERPTTGRALAHNDGGVLASTRICIRIRAAAVPSRARSLTSYCLDAALGAVSAMSHSTCAPIGGYVRR